MNRSSVTILCTLLCAILIWLGATAGLTTVRADSPSTDPAASAPATSPTASAMTSAPGTQPTTTESIPLRLAPSGAFGRAPLITRPYFVLLTRSMFVRGHVAEVSHVPGVGGPRPTNTTPNLASREEQNLVFNGVTKTATSIDALVEDVNSGKIQTVHPGDLVARGRVGKITMEKLEYLHDGRTTSIAIGQNFTGVAVDISQTPAATTGPAAPSGLSPQDILEKLRQRRQQETGG